MRKINPSTMQTARTFPLAIRIATTAAAVVTLSCGSGTSVSGPGATTIKSVRVTSDGTPLYVGQTKHLGVTGVTVAGDTVTPPNVVWSSSNALVATVSSGGIVTALALGDVTIRATSDTVSGELSMSVVNMPISSVTVFPATRTMSVGDVALFSVAERDADGNLLPQKPATWSTSDSSIATVASNGLVSAVDTGTCFITAAVGGVSGTATVTVIP